MIFTWKKREENRYFPMFAQNIDCVHVINGLPFFKGITYLPLLFSFCFVFV